MSINWLILSPPDQEVQIPTYGNYGGPDYTGGLLRQPGEPVSFEAPPIDPLDALFLQHDREVLLADTPLEQAEADLKLITEIMLLPDDAVSGEGDFYAGAAILAMIARITLVDRRPDVLARIDLEHVVATAVDLIEQGSLQPDPQETAALAAWLQQTSTALSNSDHPLADVAAAEILDLAERLGGGSLTFPLSDDALTFSTEEEKALFVEALVTVAGTETLDDAVAANQDSSLPQILETLHHKAGFHIDPGDWLF